MNTIEQIKTAIQELPPDEFRQLVDWLVALDEKRFDEQFERDMMAKGIDSAGEEELGELEDDE